jgi:hypothetical protein
VEVVVITVSESHIFSSIVLFVVPRVLKVIEDTLVMDRFT